MHHNNKNDNSSKKKSVYNSPRNGQKLPGSNSTSQTIAKEISVTFPTSVFHAGEDDVRYLHCDFDLFRKSGAFKRFLMLNPNEATMKVAQGLFNMAGKLGFMLHGEGDYWLAPLRFFQNITSVIQACAPFFMSEEASGFGNFKGAGKTINAFFAWQGLEFDEEVQLDLNFGDSVVDWKAIAMLFANGGIKTLMQLGNS